jgi:molybdopterin-guanine dinucleotide biosynthesis protein MobB
MFQFGIDGLLGDPSAIEGKRVALLSHPAGVTSDLVPTWKALRAVSGVRLVRLFGPEHGIDGSAEDMISVVDSVHSASGLPARSLYGSAVSSLSPSEDDLRDIDVLICDLQDVGSRYYTFVWTICLAMEACARAGKAVVVCDRPNPIGIDVEGEPQKPGFLSFVGLHPLPVRHGMTVGEISLLYRKAKNLDLDLTVVPMRGWAFGAGWPSSAQWVHPSPNMPTLDTAFVYPGGCLVEATNLSEGRGTTRPFEQVGAPFLNGPRMAERLNSLGLPGVGFRAVNFRPAFHKHAGETCGGVFQHVTDRKRYRPYETGLRVIEAARAIAPKAFSWRKESYEFESKPAIDLLTGSSEFRELVDAGADLSEYCRRQSAAVSPAGRPRLYPSTLPALIGVSGNHDAGKTTILEKIIPLLRNRGLSIGAIKHTPHDVEDDTPGKDSDRLGLAGADPVAFLRPERATLRRRGLEELEGVLARDFSRCDLVFVEGYKSLPLVRIEVGRSAERSVEFQGRKFGADLEGLVSAILRFCRLDA